MTRQYKTPLVFVVDDDPVTTQMLSAVLSRAGFDVASALTAADGLKGIRERRPDLVLLDVHLPDGNGVDVCRQMQQETSAAQTPILFISSNDDIASKVRGFEAGGVDYIPKPIAGEEVIARVSTHLRLRQAYEKLAELQAERIQRLAGAQETIMPDPTDLPEAKFFVSLKQALQAGGDFYDVIPVGNRVVDYLVADASGHDLAASFWTAALKTLLAEYATAANAPMSVLRSINSALARILPSGVFFTVVYARLNRQTGRLLVVNAGHPPALVLETKSKVSTLVQLEGDVVGAFSDATFASREFKLRAGDRFLLFSDGLVENGGSSAEGLVRLQAACARHPALPLPGLVQEVVSEMTQNLPTLNDVLLMGVEV